MFQIAESKHRPTRWLGWLIVFAALTPGLGLASEAPMDVFVSILPQKYFVGRVGGGG